MLASCEPILLQGTNAPRVVMVEEAAEILEAHVLSSLSPRTKQLVMIGDHKQLRPKVECYELSVQVGVGGSLRCHSAASLFCTHVIAKCLQGAERAMAADWRHTRQRNSYHGEPLFQLQPWVNLAPRLHISPALTKHHILGWPQNTQCPQESPALMPYRFHPQPLNTTCLAAASGLTPYPQRHANRPTSQPTNRPTE